MITRKILTREVRREGMDRSEFAVVIAFIAVVYNYTD